MKKKIQRLEFHMEGIRKNRIQKKEKMEKIYQGS